MKHLYQVFAYRPSGLTLPQQATALLVCLLIQTGLIWAVWLAPSTQVWQEAREQLALAQLRLSQRQAWQAMLKRPSMQQVTAGMGCDLPGVRALAAGLDLGILLGQAEAIRPVGVWSEAQATLLLTGRFPDLSVFIRQLRDMHPFTRLHVRVLARADTRNLELHGLIRCLQRPAEASEP